MIMISNKMIDALNKQVNAEFYSAYLYFSMSSNCKSMNLNGIANWFYVQAQEEMTHGLKIYNHIIERGGRATMMPIAGPKTEWSKPLEMFQDAYKHEQLVTSLINNIATLAIDEKDHATASFMQWFINEQVEEEASADAIVQKLKLMGDSGPALYMMDTELAARVFTGGALATTTQQQGA